jgi:hypothetical protein
MSEPTELLATWESGLGAGQAHRAVLLHALAGGEAGGLLDVPVGRRDRALFALRRTLFGERLNGRLACQNCETEQEFDFDVANVLDGDLAGTSDDLWVEAADWRIRLRLPTSGDLLAAAAAGPEEARQVLLTRCALTAERYGAPVDGELPADVQARIAEAIAEADSAADVRLAMPCVECGHPNSATVDIVSYLWAELDAWARGIMLDVHLLGSAYGWNETEVLALSPTRRRYYLELVGHA